MSSQSTYFHSKSLGAWNWGKIGNSINQISGSVSNVTNALNNLGTHSDVYPTYQQTGLPASSVDYDYGQQHINRGQKWLLPVAIGSGALALIGITYAMTN